MRVPIVCVDERLRQYAQTFADCFSRPQYKHFVTVLLGLLVCRSTRTLTGLFGSVAVKTSVASLSRFLSQAPWKQSELAWRWREHFDHALASCVAQHHADHHAAQSLHGIPDGPGSFPSQHSPLRRQVDLVFEQIDIPDHVAGGCQCIAIAGRMWRHTGRETCCCRGVHGIISPASALSLINYVRLRSVTLTGLFGWSVSPSFGAMCCRGTRLTVNSCISIATMSCISIIANPLPMHVRGPPPNGK